MPGYRRLVDFDFFSAKGINEESRLQRLSLFGNLSVTAKIPETLHLDIAGVKVTFLG